MVMNIRLIFKVLLLRDIFTKFSSNGNGRRTIRSGSMPLMSSISGVRGIVGESLTPEIVLDYSRAFAEYTSSGRIVVGRDGRITGNFLENIVCGVLASAGCDVVSLGVVPTPTVAIAVEKAGAAGGISITASHNPIEWNGLKFLGPSGMFLNAEENAKLRGLLRSPPAEGRSTSRARWDRIGKLTHDDSFIRRHVEMVLGLPFLDIGIIRKRKFRVVADCINAAGGRIVPLLLRELGCEVIPLNGEVDGVFRRPPEPLPENLGELSERVRREKADLGLAVDPDVDRLAFITEKGEPFGEEYTVTSAVRFILDHEGRDGGRARPAAVVVNLSTTRAIDDIARSKGARVFRTPVGEINVAQRMKEISAVIGGEGSGGVILPAVHFGRDAIVGIALSLQQLAESGGTMSALKASFPQYSIVKRTAQLTSRSGDPFARIASKHSEGTINTEDGLKLDFADSWVHLRKSNTEPIIRIIAEAPNEPRALELALKFQEEILG